MSDIIIGNRIYTDFNGYGFGTVVYIKGEQSKQQPKNKDSYLVASWGNAKFDIIFSNGRMVEKLPEAIIRKSTWKLLENEKVATTEEITELYKQSIRYKKQKEIEREQKEKKLNESMENIKKMERYSHLKVLNKFEYSNGKFVAKNIRKHLAKHFPNIKFSVRSDYNAVKVNFAESHDSNLVREVKKHVEIFQGGGFDGMRDIYIHNDNAFNKVYGGCKYIFVACYS